MNDHLNTIGVLNCGSSSIKFAIFELQIESQVCRCHAIIENIGSPDTQGELHLDGQHIPLNLPHHDYPMAMQALIKTLEEHSDLINALNATGHRVVHGGSDLTSACVVDEHILSKLEACKHLAPLHNPANILGIQTCQTLLPTIPHVAVFDTAFHKSIPDFANTYALPWDICQQHGIRKYGFHGISYDYVSKEVARRLNKPSEQCNMLVAHLGNGASICAIRNGKSVDTSMGMTPLAGLPMGTRCGDIDPSIVAKLSEATDLPLNKIMTLLSKESGLLGLSGISHDMRELVKAKAEGNQRASLALAIFAYRIASTMASYMPALQSIDALVFTGGIGENNPWLRASVANYLAFLGIQINAQANQAPKEHKGLISENSACKVFVIQTQEEQHIADITRQTIHQTTQEEKPSCDPS